jgi:membrane-bound lytic murein transglycosylase D
MDPVPQRASDDVAGARQRKDVKYFARAALATLVTLKMACLVTGCATQDHRPDASAGASARHLADSGNARHRPPTGDGPQALPGGGSGTAAPTLAQLAQRWLMPSRDFSPAATPRAAADQSDDVWTRLRNGFQLDDRSDRRVEKAAAAYKEKPEAWARIEERARRFLPLIVKEVEERRLPLELALVPVIESTFDPTAVSPGKAAGLWQIIPSTAKTLGLQRNGHYDGRRDVLAATDAALDYLQALADEFDGDWELALASYNAGSGTVRRAIARNRELGKPTDYWSLDLPAETEAYVPKLLATARVVKHPRSFGVRLADLPAEPDVTPVQVAEQIDLSLAAKLAQMSLGELRDLNPGLLSTRSQLPSQQTLLVPLEKAPTLLAELGKRSGQPPAERLAAGVTAPRDEPAPPAKTAKSDRRTAVASRKVNATHVVGKGDSLWAVARKHSVEVAELAKANRITTDTPLREGQRLTIPSGAPRTSQVLGAGFDGEG